MNQLHRRIGPTSLLFASVSAIMGSGWLFSAFYTSKFAGPASLLSWLIGGLFILIVAFPYAEICSLIPVTGSSARIPHYTHGTLVSFVFAWMNWLAYLALMAIEVQAVIQYCSFYFPSLVANANGALAQNGYILALFLMLLVSAINTYSLRWLIACNNILTAIKIAIPVYLGIVIILFIFTPESTVHAGHSSFMPNGWHGVLGAIATGGIVFSFNGFKQAAEMAGEAKNPGRSVPIAIIGSILVCLAMFLILQVAFLSSILPKDIAQGWRHMTFGSSPFAAIITQDHLSHLIPIIYIGAIISPLAASLMYCASASRSLYGLSKNEQVPTVFQWISPRGNPLPAIVLNFIAGMLLFAPLPGWDTMMSFLSSILAITYAVGPINMLALRYQLPNAKRPIKLPFGTFWAWLGFYICTLLSYWSEWQIIWKMLIAVTLGYIIMLIYRYAKPKEKRLVYNLPAASWLWIYLIGLGCVSWLGNFGGKELLTPGVDYVLLAILCAFCLYLSVKFRLNAEKLNALIASKEISG